MNYSFPHGNVNTVKDIGHMVRLERKKQGLSQADFAALCGVGVRFVSDLENGKPTIELAKTLQVLRALGLECCIAPRQWPKDRAQ
ncbi:MAG: helix-turn-helix transcriptional regulator [Gammaproteobacteria bacterium]|nr:helix-turn-helix transcriptional regulator [Gammaproteobacteria bacterium]